MWTKVPLAASAPMASLNEPRPITPSIELEILLYSQYRLLGTDGILLSPDFWTIRATKRATV
jgi:hypothetical protein